MNVDVAIVGAGPAGGLAANLLAARGLRVLLVDKAPFPRSKVCGCCINQWAQLALVNAGLDDLLPRLGAQEVSSLTLGAGQRRAVIQVPTIRAVSRAAFDFGLVQSAIGRGASFLANTRAELGACDDSHRLLHLRSGDGQSFDVAASVILAADGIAGDLLRHQPGAELRGNHHSRIGIGVWLENSEASFEPGTIYMACTGRGYTGVVRTENHSLDLAAAVDAHFLKQIGGPCRAAAWMLQQTGFPVIHGLEDACWRGTPPLRRIRSHVAFPRVFAIGDSAAYVEPFTGDGIAWALWSALAVDKFAAQAAHEWHDGLMNDWQNQYHSLLGSRQRASRWVADLLRSRLARYVGIRTLSVAPYLARPVIRFMHPAHGRVAPLQTKRKS